MGECNTILSAYTMYRHLEYYYTHPSICRHYNKCFRINGTFIFKKNAGKKKKF